MAEVVAGCSLAEAARRAGYSPRTARRTGYELAHDPEIAAQIEAGKQIVAEHVGLKAEDVVRVIRAVLLARVDHYEVGDDGRIKVREGVPGEAMGAVASFKRRTRRIVGSEAEPDAEPEAMPDA